MLPDRRAVDAVTLYAQDLDEHSIDEIDSIKVSFEIKDAEEWKTVDTTDLISVELKTPPTEAEKAAETAAETTK